jgi:hypothetical protein
MAVDPCGIMQALVGWEMKVISSLNKKFAALQRLTELLEQLGDIASALPPTLGVLVPVADIDLDAYTALQVNCPFLNLPPATTEDLNELRSKVNAAYALLARDLLKHPWIRMNNVQKALNDFQQKVNYPYGEDYIRCLNSICAAINVAGSFLENLKQADVAAELASFGQNFVQRGGRVLSDAQAIKRDEAVQVYNQIIDLRDDTVQDFRQPGSPQQPPLRVGHAVEPDFTFQESTWNDSFLDSGVPDPAVTNVGSVIPEE